MTSDRIAAIEQLGYDRREAEFLCLATLHSGSFIARHYTDFCQTAPGRVRDVFAKKLARLQHTRDHRTLNRTIIHQIRKPVFRAIGEVDNKNRRFASDLLTRRRMMSLDYVLRNYDQHFLPTEDDKVSYFTDKLGIPYSALPDRVYTAKTKARGATTKFFIHKFPVFTRPDGAAVCYIDSDGSMQAFATFIKAYRCLLSSLREASLIYVTTNPMHFLAAQSCFERARNNAPPGRDFLEMELQFRERKILEATPLSAMTVAQIKRLKELRAFPDARLFHGWEAVGIDELRREEEKKFAVGTTDHVAFSLSVLPCEYSFLGPV
ncbi:MAG: hypothetical protein M3Z85_19275 [Acidobacteriota bacterium]|nr:hypothetical protein [Acidobacteriota bacterium]